VYQNDLGRKGTSNTGKQRVKGGYDLRQGARELSPKGSAKAG